MIFLLTNTVTGESFYLPDQKEYTVGRKNCDILLDNDQSISREHAKLRVKDNHVTLEDCKSRYNTFYNGDKIAPNVEITVTHMDSIKFGIFNSKFCFESYNFLVAASALSSEKKTTLKQALSKCKGKYVDKWSSNCTHLTVDKLTLTIKVLQALIDEKPIVTLDYWTDYVQRVERKMPLPDVNNYNKPPIAEQLLRSDFEYSIDPRRKTLFSNKLFIFLKANTKKQMEDVIKSCGGRCISWEEEPKTSFDINKSPEENLLIKTDSDEANVSFDAIVKNMGKQKKRPIPINEIALAIINCSCDINCNPSFNKVSEVFAAPTQKHQTRDVLAMETESENMLRTSSIKTEKIIPPSVEDDWMISTDTKENDNQKAETSGTKRPSVEQAEGMQSKKFKSDGEANQRNEKAKQSKIDAFVGLPKNDGDSSKKKPQPSQKRKAADETDASSCLKVNPFHAIHKPSTSKKNKLIEDDNPFELTRTQKPTSSTNPLKKNDNPFANIMNVSSRITSKVKTENVRLKEEARREIKLIPFKSDSSNMSSTKRSLLNISWISKSTVKSETVKEEDPELAKIAEAFKDCVKVEVLSLYERTSTDLSEISNDNVDGKKNFKKFKKVKPLKPQMTVISRHHFKKIAPGDLTGLEVNAHDSEDEADIGNSRTKQLTKHMGKRFVL